ncbi:pyridoxamine 5'-phosphate oxidase family protein [Gordonia sp. ABSL11-1]|uniref:pyridoxine/pyridoxamine 5'-phosphate oxidase n=1 Tax=Gordonia sp. ABSL11-1 TaxID=3053924 RepID=UPI00257439CC|nr:pyridoxamine 5'-phosphate oxidase family protein [Gordonia sp. ABSL11-1]MDL9948656.1 pyridoxamine 5'-phosphate oxidase family protein [Gordonia sp. ABSL11-1]
MITSGTGFGADCPVEEYLISDPVALLHRWLPDDESPPPLMALATVGRDGYPRVRHVLLSEVDATAVYFHTDSRSSKVAELSGHPRAAIALAWPEVGRQVVAHGEVQRASDDELRRTYSRRSRYLQLLAWVNDAETAALDAAERRRVWAEFDRAHGELSPPSTWTGFAIELHEVTFWRGDPEGPSQRSRFRRTHDGWTAQVLPG